MAEHIALLGDSIFDNASYTNGLPDVISHLRAILPTEIRATLLAVDGTSTANLGTQLERLPPDVNRVVVSLGGNDAILSADALDLPIASTREALRLFGERAATFERSYRSVIASILSRVPMTTVCTIYNGNFAADEAASLRVGLALFNDVILRVAFELHLHVIDLRLICTDLSDYANPLEPSSDGAAKIARAVQTALGFAGQSPNQSIVFAG